MKEEIRLELQRKIQASFDKARGPEPPARKVISEEERVAKTAKYADLLIKAAMRRLSVGQVLPGEFGITVFSQVSHSSQPCGHAHPVLRFL